MISALHTSVSGMMQASRKLSDAATTIVTAPTTGPAEPQTEPQAPPAPPSSMEAEITAIVELSVAAHGYKANATVLATTNDMLGKLIDDIS